jgi:serine protease Do
LADPGKTFLIQHSAQVDAGNSGGPLLIAAKGAPGGYRVIGVNTWKAVSRQATNYSIPSIAISAFVGKVLGSNEAVDETPHVESRALEFSVKLRDQKKGFADAVTYISYSCTNERGVEALRKVLATAPSEVRDSIYAVFVGLSPIEAMRYSVSFQLQKEFSSITENESVTMESLTRTAANAYDCVYASSDGKWKSVWIKEQGVWRLGSIERIETAQMQKGNKKIARDDANVSPKKDYWIQTPYELLFEASVGMSPDSDHGFYFGAQVLSSMNTYLSTGINISTQSMDINTIDYYTGNDSTVSARSYLAQYVVRGQVPVMLSKFSIVPFAQVGVGIGAERAEADGTSAKTDVSACTGYSLEVGMLAAFGSKQNLYLEIGYLYRGMKLLDDSNENLADDKAGIFAISAGFGL